MMATSTNQKNTTIDLKYHDWYQRISDANPLLSMANMHRTAHEIYLRNRREIEILQRRAEDRNEYPTAAEIVGKALRKELFKNITTVNNEAHCSSAG